MKLLLVVRRAGLEPAHLAALDPKSSASTNSAILAFGIAPFSHWACLAERAYYKKKKESMTFCGNF
jgi:hypothetical protein